MTSTRRPGSMQRQHDHATADQGARPERPLQAAHERLSRHRTVGSQRSARFVMTTTSTAVPNGAGDLLQRAQQRAAVRVEVRRQVAEAEREHRGEDRRQAHHQSDVDAQDQPVRGGHDDLGERREASDHPDRAGDHQRPRAEPVESLPTCGPSRPIARPPGITSRPVSSGDRPRTSCR